MKFSRNVILAILVSLIHTMNVRGQQPDDVVQPYKTRKKRVSNIGFAVGKGISLTPSETITKKPKIYGVYTDPVKSKTYKANLKVLDKISSSSPVDQFNAEWTKKIKLYDKSALKGKVVSDALKNDPTLIEDLKLDKLVVVGWEDFSGYDFYFMKPEIDAVTGTLASGESITITGKFFGTKVPKVSVEYYDGKGNIKYKACKVDKSGFIYQDSKGRPSAMAWTNGDSSITVVYPTLKDDDAPTGYLILDNGCGLAAAGEGSSGDGVTLTMAVSPEGAGSTSPETGPNGVVKNQELAISAIPASGYEFSKWTVTDTVTVEDATAATTTATVSDDGTATAVFVAVSDVTFAGLSMAYATGTGSVSLNWPEATDAAGTSSSAMKYNIYQGTSDDVDAVYQSSNLVKTITGSTETSVDGLTGGSEYYFLAVAENAAGSTNNDHELVSVTTPTKDVSIAINPKNIEDEIGSTDVTVSDDETTVSFAGDYTATFSIGDVVIVPVDDESDHLLKTVTAISVSGGKTTLTVEDGSLGEVFQSGELSSGVSLIDSSKVTSSSTLLARRLRDRAFVWENRSFIRERERLLAQGRRVYLHPEGRFLLIPERPRGDVSLTTGLTFTPELKFEPKFDIFIDWEDRTLTPDRLNSITAIFKGKLTISGKLEFKAEASVDKPYSSGKIYLWDSPKSMKFRYVIGGVPVYQEVGVNFACEAEFQPKASLEMSSEMSLTKEVKCGISWVRDSGWKTAKADGFNKTVTYAIKTKGGSTLTLKIYPEVSTRFYRTLTTTLAVKPKLTLDAEAEADLLDSKMSQFTKFDLGVGADVQMGAKFQIFSKTIVSKETDDLEILSPVNFFGLPTVEFSSPPTSGDVDEELSLKVSLKDGKNNAVSTSSVAWGLSDAEHSSLKEGTVQSGGDGTYADTATFTASTSGTYAVYYSMKGSGFLGDMGTRVAKAEIDIGGSTPGKLIEDPYLEEWIKDDLYVYNRDLTEEDLRELDSAQVPKETATLKGLKEYCPNCVFISINGNTKLTDLSDIAGMTQLRRLVVSECEAITKIEFTTIPFESVSFSENPFLNTVKLDGNMPKLESVIANDNAISTFSLGGTSSESFWNIDLRNNKLTGNGGFSFTGEFSGDPLAFQIVVSDNPCASLSDFSKAIDLYAAGTDVSDCPECLDFPNLKRLYLWRCPVSENFKNSTAPALSEKGVQVFYTVISSTDELVGD